MARTVWHVTMSLDGFIAGPDDSMEWAFGNGRNEMGEHVMRETGAIVAGRRWYDVATRKYDGTAGIYGGGWSGPVFVLTHRPDDLRDDPSVTAVSDGIRDALGTAERAAEGKHVELFGADIARQALEAGLLDEVVVHVAPLLLGDGVRLYGAPGAERIDLERVELAESGQVVDLRFHVVASRRPGQAG